MPLSAHVLAAAAVAMLLTMYLPAHTNASVGTAGNGNGTRSTAASTTAASTTAASATTPDTTAMPARVGGTTPDAAPRASTSTMLSVGVHRSTTLASASVGRGGSVGTPAPASAQAHVDVHATTTPTRTHAETFSSKETSTEATPAIAPSVRTPALTGTAHEPPATPTKSSVRAAESPFNITLLLTNFVDGTLLATTNETMQCDPVLFPQLARCACYGGASRRASRIRQLLRTGTAQASPNTVLIDVGGSSSHGSNLPLMSLPPAQRTRDTIMSSIGYDAYILGDGAGTSAASASAAARIARLRGLDANLPPATATNSPGTAQETWRPYTRVRLRGGQEVAVFACSGVGVALAATGPENNTETAPHAARSCKHALIAGLARLSLATARHAHLPQVVLVLSDPNPAPTAPQAPAHAGTAPTGTNAARDAMVVSVLLILFHNGLFSPARHCPAVAP